MQYEFSRRAHPFRNWGAGHQRLLNLVFAVACMLAVAFVLPASRGTAAPLPAPQQTQAEVETETVHFDSGGISISAYVAKPGGGGKHPAVIIVHDNQGLTDGIRGIAQKFAGAGFVAMAPDLLSRASGSSTPQQAQAAIGRLVPNDTVQDLRAGVAFLQKYPDADPEKISSVGLGWGGWRSFMLASTAPGLYRAVVFYGTTPVDGLQNIHAPVLANYAQYDFFDTGNSIWTEDTMKGLGKKFTYYIYPKTQRGFFDTAGQRYDEDAAKLAWTRTLEFLRAQDAR